MLAAAALISATPAASALAASGRIIGVGSGPVAVAVDQATHTAYVGNGNDNTVSVINTATCNASVTSGCDQNPPTIAVDPGPVDAAVDQATDTIYVVALGGDTLSVIDGATCNATVTTGCHRPPKTVTVGQGPDGVAVNQLTDTVYVANAGGAGGLGNTVSVINGAICNANVTSGCDQKPATVNVGAGAAVPAVDQATDTVYVPDSNPNGTHGSVSVIDGATCNGRVRSGCGKTPPTVAVGFFPDAAAVDQATDTVYVTSGPQQSQETNLGSIYVINGATCNGQVISGCGKTPPTVTVGSTPGDVVVDPLTGSVFVANEEDSTVSVIDGKICNATHNAGCDQHPPVMATGFNPEYLDVDLATDTVYVANYVDNTISVLNGAACSPAHQTGCRQEAPTIAVGNGTQGIAVNQTDDTIYSANGSDNNLSVINAAVCNAGVPAGCRRAWPTVTTGSSPLAVAVNQRTNTIYTANADPNNGDAGTTVSVIDGTTCNSQVTSGCRQAPATVTVGSGPDALAVNETTDTIYVTNYSDGTVSVINGATCNATTRSGCGRTPPTIPVGDNPKGVAVDEATDTVYVTNSADGTVSIINGATCNATVTTGCAQRPPTVDVGIEPFGVAVEGATDTVYVADAGTSTVSVIDGGTCNATVATGCARSLRTMQLTGGRSEEALATTSGGVIPGLNLGIDQATDTVFVASVGDSDADVFKGAICNGQVTTGCDQTPRTVAIGGWPIGAAVSQATGTIYVTDDVDGEVSFFSAP
jgi:DNA-binding beta-propeller fold protein YncE